jgi:hypothetical protein
MEVREVKRKEEERREERTLRVVPMTRDKKPALSGSWKTNYLNLTEKQALELKSKGLLPGILVGQYDEYILVCIDVDTLSIKAVRDIAKLFDEDINKIEQSESLSKKLHIWFLAKREDLLDAKPQGRKIYEDGQAVEIFLDNKIITEPANDNRIAPYHLQEPISAKAVKRLVKFFDLKKEKVKKVKSVISDTSANEQEIKEFLEITRQAYKDGVITGWDVDRALASAVILNNWDKKVFKDFWGEEYSEEATEYILERTASLQELYTLGSLIYVLKENGYKVNLRKELYVIDVLNKKVLEALTKDIYYNEEEDLFYLITSKPSIIPNIKELLEYRAYNLFKTTFSGKTGVVKEAIRQSKKIVFEFDPEKEKGLRVKENTYIYNYYQDLDINVKPGNGSVFKASIATTTGAKILLKSVFGGNEKDMRIFYAWLALKVAKRKTPFAPVITTRQGTGKDTLIRGLLEKIGEVEKGSAMDLARPYDVLDYTKDFLVLDETKIRENGFYEKFKMVSGAPISQRITIHPKGKPARSIFPVCDFVIFSNEEHPIDLKEQDRRLLVLKNEGRQLLEVVIEELGTLLDTKLLNKLIDDIFKDFKQFYSQVNPDSIAPLLLEEALQDETKTEIAKTYNPELWLKDAIKSGELAEKIEEYIDEVIEVASDRERFLEEGLIRAKTVFRLLKEMGYKNINLVKVGKWLSDLLEKKTRNGYTYFWLKNVDKIKETL